MAARIGGSVLVTGSNRGIGLELVRQLAESTSAPAQIIAACRDLYGAQEFRSYLQKAADQLGPARTGMSCSRAAIINISTLLSSVKKCPETFSMAPMYPYRASKAALNMLTCCLAEDFQRDGILVMAIHPGWVKTDMGGPHAPVKTEDSAKGILHVMSTLTEKHNGSLLDWEGNGIPW